MKKFYRGAVAGMLAASMATGGMFVALPTAHALDLGGGLNIEGLTAWQNRMPLPINS